MSLLHKLSSDIQSQVNIINAYLKENDLPQPSFAGDSPSGLPDDSAVQKARLLLIEQASALHNLAIGPADHLRWHMMNAKFDDMALHFLADYNVFDAVPLKGSIPYSELSKKVGLGEHRLRRVLAMAFTQHYFHEPKPDHVAHTSNTAIWHGDSRARAWILHNTEEVQPWYTNKLIAASRKWGDTTDPYHVGPNLDLKPSEYKTFYQHFEEDDSGEWNGVKGKGWRLWRLYETDTFYMTGGAIKGENVLRAFDWKGLGKATVVDIAGITGYLASRIARANPDLSFVVESPVAENSPWFGDVFKKNEQLEPDLRGRFRFLHHDNHAEQPIKGAELYWLATVLHKETDDSVIDILRKTIVAMDPKKSRILTRDIVLDGGDPVPEDLSSLVDGQAVNGGKKASEYQPGLGPTGTITRLNCGIEFQVLSVMNAYERTRAEWIAVFKKADPRLTLKGCYQTIGDCASLMEWALEG